MIIYLAGFSESKAISAGKDLKRPSSSGDTQPSKQLKEELVSKPHGNDIIALYCLYTCTDIAYVKANQHCIIIQCMHALFVLHCDY